MKNVIYMIRNTANGKVYIGQTRQGIARRRAEHVARFNLGERDHKLYQAMRKYGLEAFEFSVLCCCLSPDYLDDAEAALIADYNSFHRGYNMTCGGDSVADETRAKLSAKLKGRKAPWAQATWEVRRRNGTDKIDMREYALRGDAHPSASTYLVRDPEGIEHRVVGLRAFCRPRSLDHKTMLDTLKGKQRHHKGYAVLARFNDQGEGPYTQVGGNGVLAAALAA